jgi:hypothetical protein
MTAASATMRNSTGPTVTRADTEFNLRESMDATWRCTNHVLAEPLNLEAAPQR